MRARPFCSCGPGACYRHGHAVGANGAYVLVTPVLEALNRVCGQLGREFRQACVTGRPEWPPLREIFPLRWCWSLRPKRGVRGSWEGEEPCRWQGLLALPPGPLLGPLGPSLLFQAFSAETL